MCGGAVRGGAGTTALGELWRVAGIDDRALDPLLDALFGPTVSRGRYIVSLAEAGTPVSPQTATRDLATLAQAGLLATSGEKRGRVYTAADPLLRLRREVGLGRAWRDVDPFA
ncbi:hypothetical protein HQQ82_09370 [Rathayibacter sp. VKM Ac-2856]|uniref:hypothetical protein n=1 Tax=unclassified Rathayibacter TaxID=2609250 RepID=UPI001564AA81|nr:MULTISPECIES: hypothetical protein [unclassified Rathayibacter]NQX05006.1 hypothetical protein [Rathayibacter sp. VKM Ac-2858]NQX20174.1 hypothetical protein [Rathayibacter sp. VKM Ac-2856]